MEYSSISKAYRVYKKRTKKVIETINVVIDEALDYGSKKISEEMPKEILPSKFKGVQEVVNQEEKGPSSRIKLNHPPEVIMGNMNELTLRKCTVDECVANFVSYSCYLLQVEPTKVEDAL